MELIFEVVKAGEEKIKQYLLASEKIINGWKIGSWFGDRAFYNGNWLKRAAGAQGASTATTRSKPPIL
jgi:hypothetical protein